MKNFIFFAILAAVVCYATSNIVPDILGDSSYATKVNAAPGHVGYGSRVNPEHPLNSAYGSRDNVLTEQVSDSTYGSQNAPDTTGLSSSTDSMESRSGVNPLRSLLAEQALNYGSRGNSLLEHSLNSAYGSRGHLPRQSVNSAYGSRDNVLADQALNSAYGSRGHLPLQSVNSVYGPRGHLPLQSVNSAYGSRDNVLADQALNSAYGSRGHLAHQAIQSAYGSRGNGLSEQALNSAFGSKDNSGLSALMDALQNRDATNSVWGLLSDHAINSEYGSVDNAVPDQLQNSVYGSGLIQANLRMRSLRYPIRGTSHCRCASDKIPVCGTDGLTYESECTMRCEATERSADLHVVHVGRCGSMR